jgi:hypothetical protein
MIGIRGNLTNTEVNRCVAMWREVTARYPKAVFVLQFVGYDDDPRELWEFPEVCRYVRRWARSAGLSDFGTADYWLGTGEGRLPTPSEHAWGVSFLAACGVFGEALRQTALRQHRPTTSN